MEWLIASSLLVALLPLILLLGVVVHATSPGPALYSQVRLGLRGKPYRIYKLRTMTHNCEAKTGAVWSTRNDSRITGIGRVLRDTHLDELPQLWNIVRGEMSLIGPRPERPEIVQKLDGVVPNYWARLLVRPGVTGLAQMQLPADTDLNDVRKKVAYDLYYVRKLSLWLDLRIAVSTAFYFIAAAANAVCKFMVDRYGKIVERTILEAELHSGAQESFLRGSTAVGAAVAGQ